MYEERSPSMVGGASATGGEFDGGGTTAGAGGFRARTGGEEGGRGVALGVGGRFAGAGGALTIGAGGEGGEAIAGGGAGGGLTFRLGLGASSTISGPLALPRAGFSSDRKCARGSHGHSTARWMSRDSANATQMVRIAARS